MSGWFVAACGALTFLCADSLFAGPAALHLPVAALTGPMTAPASPVDHAAFTPGPDASLGAALQGVLEIAEARLQSAPALQTPMIDGRDALLFPAIS